MSNKEEQTCSLLAHHEQQDLCTTRLPYRQGRKLTAVKVYTVNSESKHILIFGVPSLNLRRETKELFMKFGKINQFNITKHPSEDFTETYHALYESIHSARTAKKMLDNKNYYGGILHVCYAPELETIEEIKEKLFLRKSQVLGRLRNLQRGRDPAKNITSNIAQEISPEPTIPNQTNIPKVEKMYMGSENTIVFGKRKNQDIRTTSKKIKQNVKEIDFEISNDINDDSSRLVTKPSEQISAVKTNKKNYDVNNIEIVDFTSTETEVISNINDALNYNKFGGEIIKKVAHKPVNRIKFNIKK